MKLSKFEKLQCLINVKETEYLNNKIKNLCIISQVKQLNKTVFSEKLINNSMLCCVHKDKILTGVITLY